jgi:hypothetical protein
MVLRMNGNVYPSVRDRKQDFTALSRAILSCRTRGSGPMCKQTDEKKIATKSIECRNEIDKLFSSPDRRCDRLHNSRLCIRSLPLGVECRLCRYPLFMSQEIFRTIGHKTTVDGMLKVGSCTSEHQGMLSMFTSIEKEHSFTIPVGLLFSVEDRNLYAKTHSVF